MPVDNSLRIAATGLKLVPKNAVSRLAGRLASLRLPGALQQLQIRAFCRVFGVDLGEIRDPIDSFGSLQEFFIRPLVEGARPVDPAGDAVVAPCDGAWGTSGLVESGTLLQVKGREYGLAALLGDAGLAARFEGGSYATFYLSPRDYHRFHTPCALRVTEARYIPGALWPVNRIGLEGVRQLFAENERIVALMAPRAEPATGLVCIAAVGATMVGKVKVRFDTMTTNEPGARPIHRVYPDGGTRFEKGEEWGHFEFGSSLVMVATPGLLELDPVAPGTALRLGERIGRLLQPRA